MKRDINVEILRIIAILFVIGTHLKQGFYIDGSLSFVRVFIACLVGDGVAVYWAILGFFYFTGGDISYVRRVGRAIKRIVFPLFIYSIIAFYFYDFIFEHKDLVLTHSFADYKKLIFDGFIKGRIVTPVKISYHLWFLYVYFLVILLYPALKGFYCEFFKNNSFKEDLKIVILLFFVLMINDLTLNSLLKVSHSGISGVVGASFFVFLGGALYKHREIICTKITPVKAISVFLLTNIVRAIIQYNIFLKHPKINEPIFWYTCFSFINVIVIYAFIVGVKNKIPTLIENYRECILYISGLIYTVYFIQTPLIRYFGNMGLTAYFRAFFGKSIGGSLLYEIIYILIVFVCCIVLATCLNRLSMWLKWLIRKIPLFGKRILH